MELTAAQTKELIDLTQLQRFVEEMNKRLYKRRVKNKIPQNFEVHRLGTDGSYVSNTSVLMTVDRSTSGQFAFVGRNIAFLYPSDLTMFLMSYVPSEPLRVS